MFKFMKTSYFAAGAAMTMGMMAPAGNALAQTQTSSNNFSTISENITTSIQDLPGLLTGVSYLIGIMLGVLGVMKIKDHVENPTQTPLKDGAIRLASGGALFALPILFEAMQSTIGEGNNVTAAEVNKIQFNVK